MKINFINDSPDILGNGSYQVQGTKTIETIKKMRKSNKTLCTWNKIVDKIVICDNVTTLNDMAVNKSYIRYIFILNE